MNRRRFLGNLCAVTAGASLLAKTGGAMPHSALGSGDDKEKIALLLKAGTPNKWLFTGDSITQGAKHTHGMRSYVEIFSERIRWELGRVRDAVINTAVSGNTSRDLIEDIEWRLLQYKPQAVFIMLGTNDAVVQKDVPVELFQRNIRTLVERVRGINAVPVLLSPNPIVEAKAPERAALRNYIQALRETAGSASVTLVDVWDKWNTELAKKYKGLQEDQLLNDPLHPNGRGHREIAMMLFRSLSIFNEKDPTCGGEYYENKNW
ncbi:SGNH/GDSL hydrolase family protein [Niabella sp. 3A5MI-3]|nr:SGNH/GDSL hydrolase family protein [Niabella beijingensis]